MDNDDEDIIFPRSEYIKFYAYYYSYTRYINVVVSSYSYSTTPFCMYIQIFIK